VINVVAAVFDRVPHQILDELSEAALVGGPVLSSTASVAFAVSTVSQQDSTTTESRTDRLAHPLALASESVSRSAISVSIRSWARRQRRGSLSYLVASQLYPSCATFSGFRRS